MTGRARKSAASPTSPMIETTALVKTYGTKPALANVNLLVPTGSLYGLVGPNGAGKTTLLDTIAGLRAPTSGTATVNAATNEIAVLPDTPRYDPWLTGREAVLLAQHLTDPSGGMDRVDEVLEQTGLAEASSRRVGGYSRGMLQRLGVACTIVGKPRLVLLDEPASALDPQGRREILDLIAELRGTATVLFSSHILGDVQEVCDTVGVLNQGELLYQGSLGDLLVGDAVPRYLVRLRDAADAVAKRLRTVAWVEGVTAVGDQALEVQVTSLDVAETGLPKELAAAGARVVSYGPLEVTLEQAFLELTR